MMTPEEFAKELERLSKDMVKSAVDGLNENAEDLLSVSQQLAPLKEGGLMESGNVDPANVNQSEPTATVGYNKEYSLRMHEEFYNLGDTSAKKPGVDGMTVGRKYLEQPTTKYGDKYADNIYKKMSDV